MDSRSERLKASKPHLTADVWLYPTSQGGRRLPVRSGWGCPCSVAKSPDEYWDAWPLLGDTELMPGDFRKTVGFIFLSGDEAADKMRAVGKFYLWENGLIGEAVVNDG